jgi:hypothetical protein
MLEGQGSLPQYTLEQPLIFGRDSSKKCNIFKELERKNW